MFSVSITGMFVYNEVTSSDTIVSFSSVGTLHNAVIIVKYLGNVCCKSSTLRSLVDILKMAYRD